MIPRIEFRWISETRFGTRIHHADGTFSPRLCVVHDVKLLQITPHLCSKFAPQPSATSTAPPSPGIIKGLAHCIGVPSSLGHGPRPRPFPRSLLSAAGCSTDFSLSGLAVSGTVHPFALWGCSVLCLINDEMHTPTRVTTHGECCVHP